MASPPELAPFFSRAFAHGAPPFSGLTVLAGLALAYVVAQVVYAVTLHPLAGVPGPKLCAITRIPYWYYFLRGRDVPWLHGLHLRYGPELRFGPTDVSYTAARAWQEVQGYERGQPENPKAQDSFLQPVNGVPGILTADFKSHARVRRVFLPAFSERALKEQEPLFRKYADMLAAKLGELGTDGTPVEMTRSFNFTTFDAMAELCFGHPLGLLERHEYSPWLRSLFATLQMLPWVSIIAYYPLVAAVFARLQPQWLLEQRVRHFRHSADRVDQRLREGGAGKPDVWNLVEAAQQSEAKRLSRDEMYSNAATFMVAGSETTATALSAALYYLLAYPETMARLAAEVRGAFNCAEDIAFGPLAGLPYLTACLKEVLRIYPPVPVGAPRLIPAGGKRVLDRWLPPGTHVAVHHYAASHAPVHFADPDAFAPARWLPEGTTQGAPYAGDVREASQPFSWGHRNCLGQNMAMHEMRLLLARVVFSFDFELCDETQDWLNQRTFGLWEKHDLFCRVRPVGGN